MYTYVNISVTKWCIVGYGTGALHDDVIKWKHFLRYWPFARGIHRPPVNSSHKGQWRGALMFSLICTWINRWVNSRESGDLRHHRAHHEVIVIVGLTLRVPRQAPKWCIVGYGTGALHDGVIKWKHFLRYWPFARGIHRPPVNSSHKGQWRGALMFSLICTWINRWVNSRESGDLRHHRAHHEVIVIVGLTLRVPRQEYSISYTVNTILLVPWLRASPCHQQQVYWIYRIKVICFHEKSSLRHKRFEEWKKMRICFLYIFPQTHSAHNELTNELTMAT